MAALHLSGTPIDNDGETEYEFLGEISRGGYGIVHRALDTRTNTLVAMKEELQGLSPSTIREIETLKTLGPHPCIVAFKGVCFFEDDDGGDEDSVFVVMEHMKSDLDRWREERRHPYTLHVIKYIMQRILTGVAFLHDNGVMHCDIKPANVLIGDKGEIKICDFGLSARFGGPAQDQDPEVAGTLGYKAPELLMGSRSYSWEVDMWAVGCVMAEMLMDHDDVFPGETEAEQLDSIRKCVQQPSGATSLRRTMATAAAFVEAAAELTPAGFDLLERLLAFEPEKRITAGDALDHAWFRED